MTLNSALMIINELAIAESLITHIIFRLIFPVSLLLLLLFAENKVEMPTAVEFIESIFGTTGVREFNNILSQ
jgi:hypothetical protein